MREQAVHLEVLTEDECRTLLAGHPHQIGRIAFLAGGRILVLPVNYRVHAGSVVFRTEAGTAIDTVPDGDTVSFQVDEVDPTWQEGWSVLVEGVLSEVAGARERQALDGVPLRSWAPGGRDRTYRIDPDLVSGRRIL